MIPSFWAYRGNAPPKVEEIILHVLETTSDPYDLVYRQLTLNEIGTAKAIPFIAKNLKFRKCDVKDSAQLAIEVIEARGRENTSRRVVDGAPASDANC